MFSTNWITISGLGHRQEYLENQICFGNNHDTPLDLRVSCLETGMFAISSAPVGFLSIIYPNQHNSSVLCDRNSTENSLGMKGMCLAHQLRSKPWSPQPCCSSHCTHQHHALTGSSHIARRWMMNGGKWTNLMGGLTLMRWSQTWDNIEVSPESDKLH